MSKMMRFEEMDVWISARNLARNVCSATKHPLFFRDFGLRDQIRRASISIASNIAEGFESQSNPNFRRFWHLPEVQLRRFAPSFIWRWILATYLVRTALL
jgi:hypothetical protein